MVLVGINLVPKASFLTQRDWSAFCNQSLCIRKEALGTRFSGHATLLSFQTQQEQTIFIRLEVGKAVDRVRKKNIQAKR